MTWVRTIFGWVGLGLGVFALAALALAFLIGPTAWLPGGIAAGVGAVLGVTFTLIARALARIDTADLVGDPGRGLAPKGIPGRARILALSGPGARLQSRYFIHRLDLAVAGAPPGARVRTSLAVMTTGLAAIQPGTEVPIRIDPARPARVALDVPAMPGLAGRVL